MRSEKRSFQETGEQLREKLNSLGGSLTGFVGATVDQSFGIAVDALEGSVRILNTARKTSVGAVDTFRKDIFGAEIVAKESEGAEVNPVQEEVKAEEASESKEAESNAEVKKDLETTQKEEKIENS
jgi:hypothetical protein